MEHAIEFISHSVFNQFAVVLLLAAAVGLLVNSLLKQPLLIAYIIVGILVGTSFLNLGGGSDEGQSQIDLLAELGIALLLFIVGLKIDLNMVRKLGRPVLFIGLIQLFITGVGIAGISMLLGFEWKTSMLIATALAFSSTIIVVKILSDAHELDKLHGQVTLGILVVQDFAVIFAMVFITTMAQVDEGGSGLMQTLLQSLSYLAALCIGIWLFIRYMAEFLVGKMARNSELLLTFSLAWAVLLAAVCEHIGLGKELGGLLAGISIASTPYRDAIISRLTSIRDFLLLFFFVSLGTHLDLSNLTSQIGPALILSAAVLLLKPFLITLAALFNGYRVRTAMESGLSLSQISEFSFIFITLAATAGMLEESVLAMVTLVGLITISISAYLMSFSEKIIPFFQPLLEPFERQSPQGEHHTSSKKYDYIVFGYGRYGQEIINALNTKKHKVLVIDYNPEIVEKCLGEHTDARYGDANDPELYEHLPLENAKWIISAMPREHTGLTHEDPRLHLLNGLSQNDYKGKIAIAIANADSDDVKEFEKKGADLIMRPFEDAAHKAIKSMKS